MIQNTLFVIQMTQNTTFYGIYGDGRKNYYIGAVKTWSQYSSKWDNIKRFVEPWFSVIALIENLLIFFAHLEGDVRNRKRIKTKGLAEEDSLREKIEIKKVTLTRRMASNFWGRRKEKRVVLKIKRSFATCVWYELFTNSYLSWLGNSWQVRKNLVDCWCKCRDLVCKNLIGQWLIHYIYSANQKALKYLSLS